MNTEFTYGGKSWRIELWKGRYGINLGCEIGVYYKRSILSSILPGFYDCSDINYPMLSELYLIRGANKNPTVEQLFQISDDHWWLTGFLFNVTTPVVLSNNNKLAMIGMLYLNNSGLTQTYVNNLKQQHGSEVTVNLILGEMPVILWGDVNNIVYNTYYKAWLNADQTFLDFINELFNKLNS